MPQPPQLPYSPGERDGLPDFDVLLNGIDFRQSRHKVLKPISERLTLPDYLHKAISLLTPDDPKEQMDTLQIVISYRGFLGDMGYYYSNGISRLRSQCVEPEHVALMLEYWMKYPNGIWSGTRRGRFITHGTIDTIDLMDDSDNDEYSYASSEESSISEDELDGFDSESGGDEDDSEDEEKCLKRKFCERVMEFCDRELAESLTDEQRREIDEKFGYELGSKLDTILGAHPNKTGSDMFDSAFPIPPPEDCFDVYEMMPHICAAMMREYWCVEPVFALESICLLNKAVSAVAYRVFTELTVELEKPKKEFDDLRNELEEVKKERDLLREKLSRMVETTEEEEKKVGRHEAGANEKNEAVTSEAPSHKKRKRESSTTDDSSLHAPQRQPTESKCILQ